MRTHSQLALIDEMVAKIEEQVSNRQQLRPNMQHEARFTLAFENNESLQKFQRFLRSFKGPLVKEDA